MTDWRVALLRRIGAKPTKQNLRFLSTWQRWEGGHTNNDASFNWLNTTRDAPGAVGSINSVGVKKFRDFRSGINALATTLQNGKYDDIIDGFRSGDPYKRHPEAGLQTWVSGSPTGNPGYAQKVLGGNAPLSTSPSPTAPMRAPSRLKPPKGQALSWDWVTNYVFGDDPEFADLMRGIPDFDDVQRADPGPTHKVDKKGVPNELRANGKVLQAGTKWSGTHVTDGLDWNHGKQTAVDIMAAPGTSVLAPESGTVVKHGSAQGGQALYFLSDSGHLYWMGHIDGLIPVGTHVKRGGRVAVISSDHAAPHLHIDRYYGNDPGRYY